MEPPGGLLRHLIDLIIEANESGSDNGYLMSDEVVRDNMISLMAAGTETTATAMTWTLYFLDKYPEVKRCDCGGEMVVLR